MTVQVVVIGGGYAGVMAANRLAASPHGPGIEVTLLTSSEAFVERIRLHEYAAGARESVTQPYRSVLHPAVRVVTASATAIDADRREVQVSGASPLPYDYLIVAAGSGARLPDRDGVHSISDSAGAERFRAALASLPADAAVAVVGGGLTAIEVATELAERHPSLHVRLHASGSLAPGVSDRGRRRLHRSLGRIGVEVREQSAVSETGDPRSALGTDLVVWSAGFTIPGLAAGSGLPVTEDGRLRVDAALAVEGVPGIFGAGDGAKITDPRYRYHRMSCASAMPMGAHAADNVLRLLAGGRPEAISTGFVAQCVSLGRRDALVQLVAADDLPRRLFLSGRAGALAKETICRQTLRWLRGEARRGGSYSWPKGPKRSASAMTSEAAWN